MSLTNPKKVVTEERLSEFYTGILPYLGGMPDILANKFNRSDLYSTDEKLIGQWIDGKPLYQKTIVTTFPESYGWTENWIDVTDLHIENCISYAGFFHSATDTPSASKHKWFPLLQTWRASNGGVDNTVAFQLTLMNGTDYISCSTYSPDNQLISAPVYLTIQYTKTTDSAVEIGSDTDYSTTEKIVGTWIDGKPLYQKTFTGSLPTVTTDGTEATSDYVSIGANVDSFCAYNALIKNPNTGNWQPVFSGKIVNGVDEHVRFSLRDNSASTSKNVFYFMTSWAQISNATYYLTLRYTKTTD